MTDLLAIKRSDIEKLVNTTDGRDLEERLLELASKSPKIDDENLSNFGEVAVYRTEAGEVVAVVRVDSDGKILKVIWEKS